MSFIFDHLQTVLTGIMAQERIKQFSICDCLHVEKVWRTSGFPHKLSPIHIIHLGTKTDRVCNILSNKFQANNSISTDWIEREMRKLLQHIDFSFVVADKWTCLRLKMWDINRISDFLPSVPYTRMHLCEGEKLFVIACIKGPRIKRRSKFHQQISFRMQNRPHLPYMVVLQLHGNWIAAKHDRMKINGQTIMLDETRTVPGEFYMCNEALVKKYSYLPGFKKLFLNKDGTFKEFIDIQIDFDWHQDVLDGYKTFIRKKRENNKEQPSIFEPKNKRRKLN